MFDYFKDGQFILLLNIFCSPCQDVNLEMTIRHRLVLREPPHLTILNV